MLNLSKSGTSQQDVKMAANMNIEQIQEMFPSKNEQKIAQKILETIKNSPDCSTLKIANQMFPYKSANAKKADSNGLYRILDGLRALGLITYRIDPLETTFLGKDHFSLSLEGKTTLRLIYGTHKPKSPRQTMQAQYIVFVCQNCGAPVGGRSSQRSATCKNCNHKNNLYEEHKVLLTTNSVLELQEAIQRAKTQRFGFGIPQELILP